MEDLKFRVADINDLDVVFEIEKASFISGWSRKTVSEALQNENSIFLCAECNDVMLGYAVVHLVLDEGNLHNIAVRPNFQCKGIGGKLIRHAIGVAREKGLKLLMLEVRESNLNALSLYAKHGFKVVGNRRNYYSNPSENAILMTMELL